MPSGCDCASPRCRYHQSWSGATGDWRLVPTCFAGVRRCFGRLGRWRWVRDDGGIAESHDSSATRRSSQERRHPSRAVRRLRCGPTKSVGPLSGARPFHGAAGRCMHGDGGGAIRVRRGKYDLHSCTGPGHTYAFCDWSDGSSASRSPLTPNSGSARNSTGVDCCGNRARTSAAEGIGDPRRRSTLWVVHAWRAGPGGT